MKRFSKEYQENRVKKLLGGWLKGIPRNPVFRLVNDGIVTENPEFNVHFQKLVIRALQAPHNFSDVKAALQDLQQDFQESFMNMANVRIYGRNGVFAEYLEGLPTSINLPYKISEMTAFLVVVTDESKLWEVDPQEIDFFFKAHVEYAIHTLLKEHGLPAMSSLDIKD